MQNIRCPNCGGHSVEGDNYNVKMLPIPDDFQTIKDRWSGTMKVYTCLDPECETYFIMK